MPDATLRAISAPARFTPQAAAAPEGTDLDLRQLRHHTKNALLRITALVAATPGLKATPTGRRLACEVERRICLAAQASDALFGLTRPPGRLEERLHSLADALAGLLADPDQVIRIDVSCTGECPARLHEVVLRSVQELVGNAVKHGFYARLTGRIRIELVSGSQGTTLVVADDGWGLGHRSDDGEGLSLVRALIAPFGGTLGLRDADGVKAQLVLPARLSYLRPL